VISNYLLPRISCGLDRIDLTISKNPDENAPKRDDPFTVRVPDNYLQMRVRCPGSRNEMLAKGGDYDLRTIFKSLMTYASHPRSASTS
jgi:hypothetical protein